MSSETRARATALLAGVVALIGGSSARADAPAGTEFSYPATFSIVAVDPETGESGVAVASRFFAVGTVVPWARAGVGAVATQAFANTSFGWRALDLLAEGHPLEDIESRLLEGDAEPMRRQFGIVAADGRSLTYTGENCVAWAGGRSGPGYAAQGNILTGEKVVAAMEEAYLASEGKTLAERLFAALAAGDAVGGDSRGKQSAALVIVRDRAGYGGFTDRAVDIRVDDHAEPIAELGRLLTLALVNDTWNRGWTAFKEARYPEALRWQERTAKLSREAGVMVAEVLYDLGVIRLANGDESGALDALRESVSLNPNLAAAAAAASDLEALGEKRMNLGR